MAHDPNSSSTYADSPLKIAFVFDDSLDKPDGVQQYMLAIAPWLRDQGHSVHFLVGKTTRTDISNVYSLSNNISVRFNGNGMMIPLPTPRKKLRALLARERYDVLHVQVPYSPWLAARIIAAAPPTTAVVGTFHIVAKTFIVTASTWALARYCFRSVRRFDAMVAVSSAAATYARKTYGVISTVIPNAVDIKRFARASVAPKPHTNPLTILFLGRLVPRKGCITLLQAVIILSKTYSGPFKVVIGGKGPELGSLQKFVTEHNLEAVVSFAGFISEADKPQFLASADVCVFPSLGGESFGIVLVEAMASGNSAVLGGNNSGYATVLAGRPDLLFEPGNATELAQKLEVLLQNTSVRASAALWGKQQVTQYDAALVGEQLATIYNKALQKRRSPEIMDV